MTSNELIILATTPMSFDSNGTFDTLDKSDKERLKQHPKLVSNKDWQSSRYLKKQVYAQGNHSLSLSHRKGHATILSTPEKAKINAGIDLEYMQHRDFLALSEFFCTTDELHWLKKQKNLQHAFYQLWTLKESLIKVHQAELADMKKFPLINPHSSNETLTIPTIDNIVLKGLSFQPAPHWLISAVYSATNCTKTEIVLQGYGLWQDHQLTNTTLLHFQSSNA